MARPTKQGLDYFPLDVNLDSKFKFIEIKFGLKGFAIVIKIFQKIYSSCYWYKFDEDEILLFAHEINVDINEVNAIINESIDRDIFDRNLYEKHRILTSKGIQKRYQEIVKRRKDVEVIEEYLLIDGDFGINDNINEDNDNINPSSSVVNDSKSTQSKVNKSKVNKSKKDISIYGQNDLKNDPYDPMKSFEMFYSAYPKKVKKQNVIKWFQKNKPSAQLLTTMMIALEKFKKSSGWLKNNGQFIPDPTTWLNQKRWEDDLDSVGMSKEEKTYLQTLKELEGFR